MKYAYFNNGVVEEIILENDPIFPGIAITERFSSEFLSRCIPLPDSTEVTRHWLYDLETGDFSPPIIPEEPPEVEEDPPAPGQPTLTERIATLEEELETLRAELHPE
jgi:hypothetical protein